MFHLPIVLGFMFKFECKVIKKIGKYSEYAMDKVTVVCLALIDELLFEDGISLFKEWQKQLADVQVHKLITGG